MTAVTDYGIQLKRGNGATPEVFTQIAEMIDIDPPGLENPTYESTSHSTGAYRAHQSTQLRDMGEMTIKINYFPTDPSHNYATGLLGDVASGLVHNWQLIYPEGTVWTFAAFVTNFKPESSDATDPKGLKAEVTFRITGVPTLA